MKTLKIAALFSLCVALLACGGGKKEKTGNTVGTGAGTGTAATAPDKPLFERLGGLPAITKVVGDFLGIVKEDDRINHFFANSAPKDLEHLQQMLIDQICAATGGPCEYKGKSMPEAHAGMAITDDDFNALVEDLGKALDKNGVPAKEKGELVAALAPLHDQIVGK
jgi:hemoglobin